MTSDVLIRGVVWALAAGLCWGGAFMAPLILTGFSALEITAGRFAGSGLFSAVLLIATAVSGRVAALRQPRLWLEAFGLACIGNFIYFAATTAGIQRANPPIVTLIIGTLPIAIPLVSSIAEGRNVVGSLALPSLLILAGLLGVHFGAHGRTADGANDLRYATGVALAGVALAAWTAFAILNARTMARLGNISAATWSSMQGVALLPVALPILLWILVSSGDTNVERASLPTYLAVSTALGIVTSWLAMWCWNRASQLLPQSIAGQLLVFETIASLAYVYLWYRSWPPALVVAGAACLIGGVTVGIRSLSR